jgi:uncharacterized protein YeaO (DUF488 family)
MRKKFRIQSEPVKPQKKNFRQKTEEIEIISSYQPLSVDELIEKLQDLDKRYPDGIVELDLDDSDCWYESDRASPRLVLSYGTADTHYEKALKKYNEKLRDYNEWRDKYKEEIAEELRLRDIEHKEAELKKAEQLEKKAAAIRRKCN